VSSPLRTVRESWTPDWSEEAYTQVVCGVYGFYVNGELISGRIGDRSFVDMDGNFRKRVEFKGVNGKLSISLEIGVHRRQDISGSPFSIEKRIEAQGLDAYFGQASHRKRKRLDHGELTARKRRTIRQVKVISLD